MTAADDLARALVPSLRRLGLSARLESFRDRRAVRGEDGRFRWAEVECRRVVFAGGRFGEHALDLSVSSHARVLAHWHGYCEANGVRPLPRVGEPVRFRHLSAGRAAGFERYGVVLAVGETRARVAFVYKHDGRAERYVAIRDIVFDGGVR